MLFFHYIEAEDREGAETWMPTYEPISGQAQLCKI